MKMKKIIETFQNSSRRNRYEIYAEILDICTKPNIHLSFIIRNLRLQTQKCKEYLLFLLDRGLIQVIDAGVDGIVYQTTPKGLEGVKNFLDVLEKYFKQEQP